MNVVGPVVFAFAFGWLLGAWLTVRNMRRLFAGNRIPGSEWYTISAATVHRFFGDLGDGQKKA